MPLQGRNRDKLDVDIHIVDGPVRAHVNWWGKRHFGFLCLLAISFLNCYSMHINEFAVLVLILDSHQHACSYVGGLLFKLDYAWQQGKTTTKPSHPPNPPPNLTYPSLALSSTTFHSRLKTELFKLSYPDSTPAPRHVRRHHRLQL